MIVYIYVLLYLEYLLFQVSYQQCPCTSSQTGNISLSICSCRKTWAESVVDCKSKGLVLAEINDLSTDSVVARQLRSLNIGQAWIGGKVQNGDWLWINSQLPIYGQGCYSYPVDISIFTHRVTSPQMTVTLCVNTCKQKGELYAGLYNGNTCVCMSSYGSSSLNNGCTMSCSGNANERCGGKNVYYVYAVNGNVTVKWRRRGDPSTSTTRPDQLCVKLTCQLLPLETWNIATGNCKVTERYTCAYKKNGPCPANSIQIGDICYTQSYIYASWYAANDRCKQNGGTLVEMTSQEVFSRLTSDPLSPVKCYHANIWLASSKSIMTWSSGRRVTYTNWGGNFPSNQPFNTNCMYMYTDQTTGTFKWGDQQCDLTKAYVCMHIVARITSTSTRSTITTTTQSTTTIGITRPTATTTRPTTTRLSTTTGLPATTASTKRTTNNITKPMTTTTSTYKPTTTTSTTTKGDTINITRPITTTTPSTFKPTTTTTTTKGDTINITRPITTTTTTSTYKPTTTTTTTSSTTTKGDTINITRPITTTTTSLSSSTTYKPTTTTTTGKPSTTTIARTKPVTTILTQPSTKTSSSTTKTSIGSTVSSKGTPSQTTTARQDRKLTTPTIPTSTTAAVSIGSTISSTVTPSKTNITTTSRPDTDTTTPTKTTSSTTLKAFIGSIISSTVTPSKTTTTTTRPDSNTTTPTKTTSSTTNKASIGSTISSTVTPSKTTTRPDRKSTTPTTSEEMELPPTTTLSTTTTTNMSIFTTTPPQSESPLSTTTTTTSVSPPTAITNSSVRISTSIVNTSSGIMSSTTPNTSMSLSEVNMTEVNSSSVTTNSTMYGVKNTQTVKISDPGWTTAILPEPVITDSEIGGIILIIVAVIVLSIFFVMSVLCCCRPCLRSYCKRRKPRGERTLEAMHRGAFIKDADFSYLDVSREDSSITKSGRRIPKYDKEKSLQRYHSLDIDKDLKKQDMGPNNTNMNHLNNQTQTGNSLNAENGAPTNIPPQTKGQVNFIDNVGANPKTSNLHQPKVNPDVIEHQMPYEVHLVAKPHVTDHQIPYEVHQPPNVSNVLEHPKPFEVHQSPGVHAAEHTIPYESHPPPNPKKTIIQVTEDKDIIQPQSHQQNNKFDNEGFINEEIVVDADYAHPREYSLSYV